MRVFVQQSNLTATISKSDLPSVEEMVANILEVYGSPKSEVLSPESTAVESGWYEQAKGKAQEFAEKYDTDLDTVIKLIAVLSPKQRWEVNLRNAEVSLQAFNQTGSVPRNVHQFSANVVKAQSLLEGKDVKLGPKTTNFYLNISGDLNCVTVDAVAASIAMGWRDIPVSISPNDAAFNEIANAYMFAASKVGISPRELQAATWIIARAEKSENKGKGKVFFQLGD